MHIKFKKEKGIIPILVFPKTGFFKQVLDLHAQRFWSLLGIMPSRTYDSPGASHLKRCSANVTLISLSKYLSSSLVAGFF